MDTIANMTIDELKQLIRELLEQERADERLGVLGDEEESLGIDDKPDNRTLEEVLTSIERNRWTPPEGTPSAAEMIRQDRDRR